MAEEKFRGRLITVRVDEAGYELVAHPPVVVVAAIDEEERAWLVRVRRPAVGASLLETPAGLVDPGESPAEAARRELLEECGLEAERWELLAEAYTSPGFTDERASIFLATGLRPVGGDDPEQAVEERLLLPLGEAISAAGLSLPSLAALALAARRLGHDRR